MRMRQAPGPCCVRNTETHVLCAAARKPSEGHVVRKNGGMSDSIELISRLSTAELWALWVSATGTILAALVPTVLFLVERHERKALQEKLDAEPPRQAKLAGQRQDLEDHARARRVFARSEIIDLQPLDDGSYQAVFRYSLNNRSEWPVWDVRLIAKLGNGDHEQLEEVSRLDPFKESETQELTFASTGLPHLEDSDVIVTFSDHAGDLWRTFRGGKSERQARELDTIQA